MSFLTEEVEAGHILTLRSLRTDIVRRHPKVIDPLWITYFYEIKVRDWVVVKEEYKCDIMKKRISKV